MRTITLTKTMEGVIVLDKTPKFLVASLYYNYIAPLIGYAIWPLHAACVLVVKCVRYLSVFPLLAKILVRGICTGAFQVVFWVLWKPLGIFLEFVQVLTKLLFDFVFFPVNVVLFVFLGTSLSKILAGAQSLDKKDYMIIGELLKIFLIHWSALLFLGVVLGSLNSLVMFKLLNSVFNISFLKFEFTFKISTLLKYVTGPVRSTLKIVEKVASLVKNEISNLGLQDPSPIQSTPLPSSPQASIGSLESVSKLPLDKQTAKPAAHTEHHAQTSPLLERPLGVSLKSESALSSRDSVSSISPGKRVLSPSSSKANRKHSIHATEPIISLNSTTGGVAIRRMSSTREELATQLPKDYFQQLQTPANSDTEKEGPEIERTSVQKLPTYSSKYSGSQSSHSELGEDEEAEFDDASESVFSYSREETARTKVGTNGGSAKTSGAFVPRIHAANVIRKSK